MRTKPTTIFVRIRDKCQWTESPVENRIAPIVNI